MGESEVDLFRRTNPGGVAIQTRGGLPSNEGPRRLAGYVRKFRHNAVRLQLHVLAYASIVAVPKQRNSRKENAGIKAGETEMTMTAGMLAG